MIILNTIKQNTVLARFHMVSFHQNTKGNPGRVFQIEMYATYVSSHTIDE